MDRYILSHANLQDVLATPLELELPAETISPEPPDPANMCPVTVLELELEMDLRDYEPVLRALRDDRRLYGIFALGSTLFKALRSDNPRYREALDRYARLLYDLDDIPRRIAFPRSFGGTVKTAKLCVLSILDYNEEFGMYTMTPERARAVMSPHRLKAHEEAVRIPAYRAMARSGR